MRIALLTNPAAGRNKLRLPGLLRQLAEHPSTVHVETPCRAAVPEALEALARCDVGLLVVNGGDGTLSEVLTSLLAHRPFGATIPPIALLAGGRTNMAARSMGAPRDISAALRMLVKEAQEGRLAHRIESRPVLRLEWGGSAMRRIQYGTFFGAGVFHRATTWMRENVPARRQGVSGTSLLVAGLLGRLALPGRADGMLAADKIDTMLDGWDVSRGEQRVLMATSLQRILLGLNPFWGPGEGGVRLTSIAAHSKGVVRALPGVLCGEPPAAATEERGFLSRRARRADIRLDCGFTLDGEIIHPVPGRVVTMTADDEVRFVVDYRNAVPR